jgi:hypothetical protein
LVEKSSLTRTVADAAASRALKKEIRGIVVLKNVLVLSCHYPII